MKASFVSLARVPSLSVWEPAHPPSALPAAPEPDPVVWARETLGFHPDPRQATILADPAGHLILCCSRQFGKTTLAAIKAAHHALLNPGSTVIVGSPSERQSWRLVRKAAAFLTKAGLTLRPAAPNTYGLLLPNSSAIYALPGRADTTRGFDAVSLLIFEEAAFVPDPFYHMATAFQAAVENPHLWLLSTPGPQSGFFYDEWTDQARPWSRHQVPATECPRITPDFLAKERQRKGEAIYRREYLCDFTPGDLQLFPRDLIESALEFPL